MNTYFKKAIKLGTVAILTGIILFLPNQKVNAEEAVYGQWKNDNIGWWFESDRSYAKGWNTIDDKWYYFYNNGYMAHDTTIDGYYIDSDGEWIDDSEISYEEFCNNVDSQMLNLINKHRKSNGVFVLIETNQLRNSAKEKSKHMSNYGYFSHYYNGQDSRQLFNSQINAENIEYKCFNNKYTKRSAKELAQKLFDGWKESSGHNANMLNSDFSEYGFSVEKGVYNGSNVFFATQMFKVRNRIGNEHNMHMYIDKNGQEYIYVPNPNNN
ncbi:CAP domain-containing protein [Clostridium sp. CMCC3677]|uniref:CAP domain-containing protein n=1 Tax=Clostridium sp. CMCC3677 TaxID=2949963 RepID=UPI0013F0C2F7|nr:CAP domain-containing protein [Clostridium sp. CMCC3677]NFG63024.1 hypothetical protein [Clostridium botulinum]NFQ08693.1 hypothetical protein [Clostridium botulinum]